MSQGFLSDDGALRMWFRDEIRNALLSAYATSTALSAVSSSPEATAFHRGFVSALVAIGLNFGIAPLPFAHHARPVLPSSVLDAAGETPQR
jgi:imidazolonepropionase-like amidohydrolase